MSEDTTHLTTASSPVQVSAIESALLEGGIPFSAQQADAATVVMGATLPLSAVEFRVPSGRLQEAKDLLCASDIVCDVSDRLLQRTFEEVVKPLLGAEERDFDRLLYLIDINNKETVRALFELTLATDGGEELLEELFFAMAGAGSGRLSHLARLIADRVGEAFSDRFIAAAKAEGPEARLALLEALPEFRHAGWRFEALASCLLDGDPEIRDAASEALFALGVRDSGYDPEAPPLESEAIVREILKKA